MNAALTRLPTRAWWALAQAEQVFKPIGLQASKQVVRVMETKNCSTRLHLCSVTGSVKRITRQAIDLEKVFVMDTR